MVLFLKHNIIQQTDLKITSNIRQLSLVITRKAAQGVLVETGVLPPIKWNVLSVVLS